MRDALNKHFRNIFYKFLNASENIKEMYLNHMQYRGERFAFNQLFG